MTASSVTSVSLDPPLVSVCVDTRLFTHRLIREGAVFAINVLGRDQVALGRVFAGMDPEAHDRFAGAHWRTAVTGAPILTDGVAWLDCTVEHAYPGGDHTIFVGRVRACATPRPVSPLLYHGRDWGQLADPLPECIELADAGLAHGLVRHGTARPDITRLTGALRAVGIRVRLAPPTEPADATHPRDVRETPTGAGTSAPVTTAADVEAAARQGAATVEMRHPGRPTTGAEDRGLTDIVRAAHASALGVILRLTDAFDPRTTPAVVTAVRRAEALGCAEVCLDEGAHAASPPVLRLLLHDALAHAGPVRLRVGLREQHGMGIANALTAMKSGARLFDTTLGGIDGRLASEDLLYLAHRLGVPSPTDRAALLETAADLERVWGAELPARTYRTAC